MKKLIALLLAGTLLLLGCAQQNLTPQEKEAYHKSKMKYDAGQRGGP